MPANSDPDASSIKRALRAKSLELGFLEVGVSKAESLCEESARLRDWLLGEKHGTMKWMEGHFEKRIDPCVLVPGARSVVTVLENYYQPVVPSDAPEAGKISRYAWGDDYHLVMREKLNALLAWLKETWGADGRAFVDSAPVMDKAWAVRSGVGWLGKHSNVISQKHGSWFFIGELIVDIELEPDHPVEDMCGSCTSCIDACPTNAIVEPYVVDAKKCISYLTIEHREDDIDASLQNRFDNWIYGCDVCQDVCPWNKFSRPTQETRYAPRPGTLDTNLTTWSELDEETFRDRFSKSAVKRTKWKGFKRNVRMALENLERGSISSTTPPD